MTTEDDFQAALDAHPDDWQTRLVFADWLEECAPKVPCPKCGASGRMLNRPGPDGRWVPCPTCHGAEFVSDPRAEGMRAMGRHRCMPHHFLTAVGDSWMLWEAEAYSFRFPLPHSDSDGVSRAILPKGWHPRKQNSISSSYLTRREAEDAAALAFAKLPPNRRAELLAGV